jgi:tetratricopeptide (TPR) repeat protein
MTLAIKESKFKSLFLNERNYFLFYIAVLSSYTIYYLFQWPVTAVDTDLWYHLNGGRYIMEHHALPTDSFFSFVVPSRKLLDYYWLFQVQVYNIHAFLGYYGLICFRALLFIGLVFFVFRFFVKNLRGENRPYILICFLSSAYLLFLLSRYSMIRPHMVSYLFVALFLYVLEYERKVAFLLPVFALLWVNIHGIEYPVMLLIVLAYLIEYAVGRVRSGVAMKKEELSVIIPLVLVLLTVYCTPLGVRLLEVPFVSTGFASIYIGELKKLGFSDLFSFHLSTLSLTHPSVFFLVFVLSILAIIHVALGPARRISHLILFFGGVLFLTKGLRLAYEYALLVMPVLKDAVETFPSPCERARRFVPAKALFFCFLALIPLVSITKTFTNLPAFPTSNSNLPHGVSMFLQKLQVGGNVLNHPDTGGYLQWALYPKYKIFMDMEAPFLFTDDDMYIALKMYSEKPLLDGILKKYDPSFISVPLNELRFRDLIKFYPQYSPVFFDDREALYVHEGHHPSIVREYGLHKIDPFAFSQMAGSQLIKDPQADLILAELKRMYPIDPSNGIVNFGISLIYANQGDYQRAIAHADNFITAYPDSHTGYNLKGDIQKALKKYDEALRSYNTALKKYDLAGTHRSIGLIYFEKKMYGKAYDMLIDTVNIYSPDTSYKDVYYVIYSAVKIGLIKEAEVLFGCILESIPTDDKEWQRKYEDLRNMIKTNGK